MAKADTQKQVQELLKRAEDGARAVFESDNYRHYLSAMSKFHDYSFRNTLLIYLQKPEASHVAGYVAWQKNFNRQVQRGEKGIQIVGYAPKNIKQEQEKTNEQGEVVLGADGRPETETVIHKIPNYVPVYVYDVSQTEGEPLPTLVNELDGSVEAYQELMAALMEVSPFPIGIEEISGGVNGYYSPAENRIAVRQGMSEAQTIKTTIHEITHADLHSPEADIIGDENKDRRTKEVEAESTAYVVCNHYGIDTSDYSFGYLAAWSASKELLELQNSLDTIQKQANELIDRIDNRLAELQKDRNIEILDLAVADKNVTIEEMQEYGYTEKTMLPLNEEKATELFVANKNIHLLYSDNTEAAASAVNEIKDHADKGGLCGIEVADYIKIRATELAGRYDTLAEECNARQAYPFSIENPEERIGKIGDRIQALDFTSLDRVIDLAIAAADDGESKDANIRTYSQLKDDCNDYQTDKLKQSLSEYNGEPIVVVRWSESPALSEGQVFSLHEANNIFRDLDTNYSDLGYDKTAFTLIYDKDGKINTYEGRQDFGDREGGVIDHIENFWKMELSPDFLSQHLAAGNTDLIDHAKEAINNFVPYLKLHDNLGQLEDAAKTHIGQYESMQRNGITITDYEGLMTNATEMIKYVAAARTALNTGADLPTIPRIQPDMKEAAEQTAQMAAIRKEYTVEAAALGISVAAYAAADWEAPTDRKVTIYQMKDSDDYRGLRFEPLDHLEQSGVTPALSMYDMVYENNLPQHVTLDNIFEQFNLNRPTGYAGRSLSVSDIIVIEYNGERTANYVDSTGYQSLPDFAAELQQIQKKPSLEIVGESTLQAIDYHQDSIKHDNDIDLDREKTREQLAFNDTPTPEEQPEKRSMADRIKAAKEEATRRNAERDRQRQGRDKDERDDR
jgi:Antirestriction protein